MYLYIYVCVWKYVCVCVFACVFNIHIYFTYLFIVMHWYIYFLCVYHVYRKVKGRFFNFTAAVSCISRRAAALRFLQRGDLKQRKILRWSPKPPSHSRLRYRLPHQLTRLHTLRRWRWRDMATWYNHGMFTHITWDITHISLDITPRSWG